MLIIIYSIVITIIIIIEAPSSPRNVTVMAIGAEYVNISWINPVNSGTPTYNQYRIVAVSSVNTINVTIEANVNILFTVTGLKPNTSYSISIRALSTVDQLGLLMSEPSDTVTFTTMLGGK